MLLNNVYQTPIKHVSCITVLLATLEFGVKLRIYRLRVCKSALDDSLFAIKTAPVYRLCQNMVLLGLLFVTLPKFKLMSKLDKTGLRIVCDSLTAQICSSPSSFMPSLEIDPAREYIWKHHQHYTCKPESHIAQSLYAQPCCCMLPVRL